MFQFSVENSHLFFFVVVVKKRKGKYFSATASIVTTSSFRSAFEGECSRLELLTVICKVDTAQMTSANKRSHLFNLWPANSG